jgi:hypothetical protein
MLKDLIKNGTGVTHLRNDYPFCYGKWTKENIKYD